MTSEFAIAVHALVFLDRSNATIASEELADNVCTNPVCIRRVMGKLKKAGLISESREKNYIYYSLNASVLEEVLLWLQDLKGEGKK